MAAPIVTNGLNRAILKIEVDFAQGKAADVLKRAQDARIAAVAVGVLTAVGGLLLTAFALWTAPATSYLSSLFLIPAALAFEFSYECYKATKIFDQIIKEAARRPQAVQNPAIPFNPSAKQAIELVASETWLIRRLLS